MTGSARPPRYRLRLRLRWTLPKDTNAFTLRTVEALSKASGIVRPVLIRPARRIDLERIVDLLADDVLGATREEPSRPLAACYEQAFQAIARDDRQLLAVAEVDGAVAGCLQVTFVPGLSRRGMWRGQIESVRVATEHRGGGVGRQLVQWAIDECRDRGCGLVQLTTDKARPEALRFYESLGFRSSHEGMKLDL